MVELSQALRAEVGEALVEAGVSYSVDALLEQACAWASFMQERDAVGSASSMAEDVLMLAEAAKFERLAVRLAETLPTQALELQRVLVALDDALAAALYDSLRTGDRLEQDARAGALVHEAEMISSLARGFVSLTPKLREEKLRAHQQRLGRIAVVLRAKLEVAQAASMRHLRATSLRTAS